MPIDPGRRDHGPDVGRVPRRAAPLDEVLQGRIDLSDDPVSRVLERPEGSDNLMLDEEAAAVVSLVPAEPGRHHRAWLR